MLSVLVKEFKISQRLAKLQARKLIASHAQCVWHCPAGR